MKLGKKRKSTCHHINIIKEKKHMIILTDTEIQLIKFDLLIPKNS